MSPTLWSGAAAVPGVLQLGRAQLWFGCILYFYCLTLTLMALISNEWICKLGSIDNQSCPQCPSWEGQHGKDHHQLALLTAATVLGALGYMCLALRWYPSFARFPVLKLLSVFLLVAVIVLDFEAHFSYRSTHEDSLPSSSTSATSDSLFFCTAYSFAEIAAVYGCLTVGLLAWHEAVEWSVRRKMRQRREKRRQLRAQQQQSTAVALVVEQPNAAVNGAETSTAASGAAVAATAAAASPSQLEDDASTSPAHPSPSPPVFLSMPSSHVYGSALAASSSYFSSLSLSQPASAIDRGRAGRPSMSSSAVEWCEWLGLYTRADTKLDSLLLKWTWKDQLSPMQRRLVLSVNAFFLLLYFGGLIISSIEGWALLDGVNYILSSWCTLGYGLYTPITTGGRLFMYVYWPVGFIVISSTSTTIWRVMLARVDRALKEATENFLSRDEHNKATQPARNKAHRTHGRAAEANKHNGAGARGGADHSEEEETSESSQHGRYPALRDIVFNSPSARHSLSHEHRPTIAAHAAQTESSDHHAVPLAQMSSADSRLGTDGTAASPSSALRLTSPARLSAARPSPGSSIQQVEPWKFVAASPRRTSLPGGRRADRLYAPTARYPLSSGRGHLSLTVYEAEHEPDTLPSLADVFAPLHSPAPANVAGPVAAAQPATQPATAATASGPSSHFSPSASAHQSAIPPSPLTSAAFGPSSAAVASHKTVSASELTAVPSSLRDDFLAHLRQQTSREQLRRDIQQHRRSTSSASAEQQLALYHLSSLPEDVAEPVGHPPPSPHSSVSARPSSPPLANPPLDASTPAASAILNPALPSALSSLRAAPAGVVPPLLRELGPLLVKLGIAVLSVICWICVAGGVFVWSEDQLYDYWNCQWSAFNLLTTISVGSIATPFSIKTSSFFVWYLLLGVGTLAYCFALIAQLAFIAFDKREAVQHQHAARKAVSHRSMAHLREGGALPEAVLPSGKRRQAGGQGEEGFVAHAKELDSLILQLVQQQAAAVESEEDAEKQHQAFMRNPVLVLGRDEASGDQVELPLEGVSLLLRYHLAFQAFERERERLASIRKAQAARRARQRSSKRTLQQSPVRLNTEAAGVAAADGNAQPQQGGGDGSSGSPRQQPQQVGVGEDGEVADDGDEEEEKLAGNGPTDQWFDWSNDTDWIAQAEEESSVAEEPPAARQP